MQEVIATHPRTFDGPVAALRHRDGDQLVVAAGTYFDMLATCESLAAEWRADPRRTPLRDWADELAGGDPVATGRGRVAAVGVSLAVTVTREGVRRLLLGRRSAAVATDGGRWHVVPSGMLEPTSAGEPLLDTMLRELAEETGIGPVEQPRLLGLGFDLLRLRPEVCLHVEIGDGPAGVTGGEFDRDELVPLDWTDLWRRFGPDQLTPAAAATLALLEDQMG
jgi:ADP-ribose pyrophosphatase YjhB (NUDIX family)